MGEVVNLRTVRKRAAKAAEARTAEASRARHGLSKAEKQRLAAENARAEASLDGHRRDAGADGPPVAPLPRPPKP